VVGSEGVQEGFGDSADTVCEICLTVTVDWARPGTGSAIRIRVGDLEGTRDLEKSPAVEPVGPAGSTRSFVGRQRRLRVGDEWYRIDLLFFHRRLRCLVIIDLKLDKFTHADAGQMHLDVG